MPVFETWHQINKHKRYFRWSANYDCDRVKKNTLSNSSNNKLANEQALFSWLVGNLARIIVNSN